MDAPVVQRVRPSVRGIRVGCPRDLRRRSDACRGGRCRPSFYGVGDQRLAQLVEPSDRESRVGLLGWPKGGFDTDVELLIAALEPAAAASAERSGLLDFSQAENRAVEFASGEFAALRSGYLDVVDAHDQTIHLGEHANQLALGYLQPGRSNP